MSVFFGDCQDEYFPDRPLKKQTQLRKTWFLHFGEDVVQLRPGTNVVQEHIIDLWSEVFLGDGVVLQQTTTAT